MSLMDTAGDGVCGVGGGGDGGVIMCILDHH